MIRRLLRTGLIGGLCVALWAPMAYAHGGMAGPDELGPPVIISTLLGIACYWTIVLWPSGREGRRRKNNNVRRLAR